MEAYEQARAKKRQVKASPKEGRGKKKTASVKFTAVVDSDVCCPAAQTVTLHAGRAREPQHGEARTPARRLYNSGRRYYS